MLQPSVGSLNHGGVTHGSMSVQAEVVAYQVISKLCHLKT